MSYRFTLRVTRVECLGDQQLEWGKDEMNLFAFGISRKGQLFATGYRKLGSYETGDVQTSGVLPQMLIETELEDDGLDVLFYAWLIEEDGGGVRRSAAALEAEFRAAYLEKAATLTEIQFARECIPFTAFYKTAIPFGSRVSEAGTDGNNDEVFSPVEMLIRHAGGLPGGFVSAGQLRWTHVELAGAYMITLEYRYSRVPLVSTDV